MRHVPHVLLTGPWHEESIALSDEHRHHLRTVLRLSDDAAVSYTDGAGATGSGTLSGSSVIRGAERRVARDVFPLTVAVVPLREKHRNRFLVEKLAEMGTARLVWVQSDFGQGRPPSKAQMWADQALEQSRGSWRMTVGIGTLGELRGPVVVADPGGERNVDVTPETVLIGPEGGWSESELRPDWPRWSLGTRILRSETAAIVAVAQFLILRSDSRDE